MNVLVIGAGAIGSFYGSLLARSGATVTMLARSDYAHIKTHGIDLTSETPMGHWHFTPAAVVRHAAELSEKPDYVLLCIKLVEGADRAGLIREALGPDTAIVLLANGVEIEDELAAAFPHHELISALAFICVTRTAPGTIWHQAYGRLSLGGYPSGLSAKARALAAAFESTGIRCAATADIVTTRWQKCLWNTAFNPLSILSGGLRTDDILTTGEPLVRAIMGEVSAIAAAIGHPVPPDSISQQIDGTHRMPPYKTSMLIDFEAGRPLETEVILGNTVRAGQRAGVAIPHLETLYALMKLREWQLRPVDEAQ
jgi:2-dehydropantoate 2-reductase